MNTSFWHVVGERIEAFGKIFAEFWTKHSCLKLVYRFTNFTPLCHGTITYILQTYTTTVSVKQTQSES